MLLPNEDVRHRALARNPLERVLERSPVVNLVKLDDVGLCTCLGEERLGRFAVGAVGFGENSNGVVVNDRLGFGLCGRHGCGINA